MVYQEDFKGCTALILENQALRVALLPSRGGKIASIFKKSKRFELLFQNRSGRYLQPKLYDAFEQFDASGFDDAFPSIDGGRVCVNGKEICYPDHGEIWTMNCSYAVRNENVFLRGESAILPYRYEKSLRLEADSLMLHYDIVNTGGCDFPCIWAMHCLLRCEQGMKLLFPKGTSEVQNVLRSRHLGEEGAVHRFPVTQTPDGKKYFLDGVLPESAQSCEKYYVKGRVCDGVCGAYFPSYGATFQVIYDAEALPYLGFWVTEGGFRGDYNCAMEPANGYYDSIQKAKEHQCLYILKKGETLSFDLRMEIC